MIRSAPRNGSSRRGALLAAALVLSGLLAWEAAAATGLVSLLYFPPPLTIGRALLRMANDGSLAVHLRVSLARLGLGLLAGGSLGLALGLAMGWSRPLRDVADPLVAATHPIPKMAILPLLLLLLGLGEAPKIVVVALATFFPMLINAMAGVRQIRPAYLDVARSCGARPRQLLSRLIWPGSLPFVLAGARVAMNTGLLVTIAVELVAAQEGLGAMLWLARETLRTEDLYAGLAVISALGIGFNLLLRAFARRAVPWQAEPTP